MTVLDGGFCPSACTASCAAANESMVADNGWTTGLILLSFGVLVFDTCLTAVAVYLTARAETRSRGKDSNVRPVAQGTGVYFG